MPLSRMYIYNSGEKENLWSNGPAGQIGGTGTTHHYTLTKASAQLKIDGSGFDDEYASFVSGPYRMEHYESVSINWSYGADANGVGSTAIFALDPSGDTKYDNYAISVDHILGSPGAGIDTVDVSSLSGEYYVYIVLETDGKPNSTYAYIDQVYFSGNIPNASSTIPLGECVCLSEIETTGFTGTLNSTFDSCGLLSFAGNQTNNYGQLGEQNYHTLNDVLTEILAYTSINGSGNNSLSNLTINSYGGPSSNYGGLSSTLSSSNLIGSGGNFETRYAFLSSVLRGSTVDSSGTTDGVSVYSVEWKRFTGRSCIILDKEYSASTTNPSGDCFSMLKPLSLGLKNGYGPLYYSECDCSINVPIYLNRDAHEDVILAVSTAQPTTNIDYSGVVVPAVVATDYVHHTGLYTIPSGSNYVNFPVTLINNSSTDLNYFNVNVLYAKTRNICQGGTYTINIVLGSG